MRLVDTIVSADIAAIHITHVYCHVDAAALQPSIWIQSGGLRGYTNAVAADTNRVQMLRRKFSDGFAKDIVLRRSVNAMVLVVHMALSKNHL